MNLGSATGPFDGGASGSLYGLYDQGVPSGNLIQGMGLQSTDTKAQDGQQHPGSDALEIAKPFTSSGGKNIYIYMTDVYRNFPYERTTLRAVPGVHEDRGRAGPHLARQEPGHPGPLQRAGRQLVRGPDHQPHHPRRVRGRVAADLRLHQGPVAAGADRRAEPQRLLPGRAGLVPAVLPGPSVPALGHDLARAGGGVNRADRRGRLPGPGDHRRAALPAAHQPGRVCGPVPADQPRADGRLAVRAGGREGRRGPGVLEHQRLAG